MITLRGLVTEIGFWAVFYGLIGISWLLLIAMAVEDFSSVSTLVEALCVSTQTTSAWELTGMWGLMMLAMMLPTFRAHAAVHADIRRKSPWPSHTLVLVLGFSTVWLVLVPVGAFAQYHLSQTGIIDPSGRATSLIGNGCVLLLAGAYQFSDLKRACMTQCASPMHYFFKYWRDHHWGALHMGIHLGVLCVGCCWALMALAFVGGTMNILWMAVLTAMMIFDKHHYFNDRLSQFLGRTLVLAGGLIVLLALTLEVFV